MTGADLFVLIAYFVTMLAIGMAYSRQKSCDMYFAGDRQVSWWLGGISYFFCNLSAFAIIVYAGMGYQYGTVALTIYWATVPGIVFATLVFARRWRRAGVITPTEFLTNRFSPATCQVFVWSGIPPRIADEALKIAAIGIFASGGMKISPTLSMLVVGLAVLAYSVVGGLWAAIVTIFVQFVLVTGAIVPLLSLSYRAAGGWKQFSSQVPHGFLSPVGGPYTWVFIVALLLQGMMSQSANWPLIQKFYSARSDRDALRVGWLGCLLTLVLPAIWIVTGMFARGFLPHDLDPQTVYARVSVYLLPTGILGLIVAALFAPTMSALSSGYNVVASILTVDVYQRLIRPHASQQELVNVGRWLTALVALSVLGLALVITYFHWLLFNIMVFVWGLFVPPTVIPVLAGLVTQRLSTKGALAAFAGGMGVGLGLLVCNVLIAPANPMNFEAITIIVAFAATLAIIAISAIGFPVTGEAAERAAQFFATLRRPSAAADAAATATNPIPVAGVIILVMGLTLVIVGLGVFPATKFSPFTLGLATVFVTVGLGMALPGWLGRRTAHVDTVVVDER